jgi:hypothetical protein
MATGERPPSGESDSNIAARFREITAGFTTDLPDPANPENATAVTPLQPWPTWIHEMGLRDAKAIPELAAAGEGYGANVFSMSRDDFYRFCMRLANGQAGRLPVRADAPLVVLKKGGFTEQEQYEVLDQAVAHWIPHIKGKEVVHEGLIDPTRHITREEENFGVGLINHLSRIAQSLPKARERLYDLTVELLHDSVYSRGEDFSTLVATLSAGIRSVVESMTVPDPERGWRSIRDPEGLYYFVDKILPLQRFARDLHKHGKPREAEDIRHLAARIAALSRLPPAT